MKKHLKKNKTIIWWMALLVACIACKVKQEQHASHDMTTLYTCPMPEDSVFSEHPGTCPKCGMDLVEIKKQIPKWLYTCPMPEDSVFSEHPGTCPKCGMDLVKITGASPNAVAPNTIVSPSNEAIDAIKIISPVLKTVDIEVSAKGAVSYNPQNLAVISARYAGRIDKLYIKYNFQKVVKGQKIMEIYSPELVTAQQDYIFLLQNSEELNLLQAAKQKLVNLGLTEGQLDQLAKVRKVEQRVSIYAPYSGHIHQSGDLNQQPLASGTKDMKTDAGTLTIREGMYVSKGDPMFNLVDLSNLWVILKIYPQDLDKIRVGNEVHITSEVTPDRAMKAKIQFIEPMLDQNSKFASVRIPFKTATYPLFQVGTLVNASIKSAAKKGIWIPTSSIMDLGNGRSVVFKKEQTQFKASEVSIGVRANTEVLIINGLDLKDSIALNASYLSDSDSFINIE